MAGEVRKLVEGCRLRFFETPMGKALLDEQHPLYGGSYAGANSLESVRAEVESADFVLYVGALKSDFNSGSFSVNIDPKIIVELHSFSTTVGYASYPATDIRHILPLLVPAFHSVATQVGARPTHGESLAEKQKVGKVDQLKKEPEGKEIRHAWLWPRMGEWFKDDGESSLFHSGLDLAYTICRYHHYRDWHFVIWTHQCPTSVTCYLRRSNLMGRNWMVSRRMSRCCSSGERDG